MANHSHASLPHAVSAAAADLWGRFLAERDCAEPDALLRHEPDGPPRSEPDDFYWAAGAMPELSLAPAAAREHGGCSLWLHGGRGIEMRMSGLGGGADDWASLFLLEAMAQGLGAARIDHDGPSFPESHFTDPSLAAFAADEGAGGGFGFFWRLVALDLGLSGGGVGYASLELAAGLARSGRADEAREAALGAERARVVAALRARNLAWDPAKGGKGEWALVDPSREKPFAGARGYGEWLAAQGQPQAAEADGAKAPQSHWLGLALPFACAGGESPPDWLLGRLAPSSRAKLLKHACLWQQGELARELVALGAKLPEPAAFAREAASRERLLGARRHKLRKGALPMDFMSGARALFEAVGIKASIEPREPKAPKAPRAKAPKPQPADAPASRAPRL